MPIAEIADHAMIRELHIYGPAVPIGESSQSEAQHKGLGVGLLAEAKKIATQTGFNHLAVISAIGTKAYYARHGFESDGLYQISKLLDSGM